MKNRHLFLLLMLLLSGIAIWSGTDVPTVRSHYHKSPQIPDTLRQDTTKTKKSLLQNTNPVTDLTIQDMIPPSPSAMEIIKGITYPADLHSGLLRLEIPLYEIVDGDLHIPITLSYHASGLKPGVHCAAWLPQGWSLSVGPTLWRQTSVHSIFLLVTPFQ